jgi:DNA-binding MarR family transcriptional regulator
MTYDRENDLGRLIYFTSRDLHTFGEKFFGPYGITPEQFHLLENLSAESGRSQREIGQLVRKTPANVTRILDRLEARGLVTRRNDPGDRRATLVFLTGSGQALADELYRVIEPLARRVVQGIDPAALQQARQVLLKIKSNLGGMVADLNKK